MHLRRDTHTYKGDCEPSRARSKRRKGWVARRRRGRHHIREDLLAQHSTESFLLSRFMSCCLQKRKDKRLKMQSYTHGCCDVSSAHYRLGIPDTHIRTYIHTHVHIYIGHSSRRRRNLLLAILTFDDTQEPIVVRILIRFADGAYPTKTFTPRNKQTRSGQT